MWKVSEDKLFGVPIKRYAAKFAFPVAKIGINIAKNSIDMALPVEMAAKIVQYTNEGIKLNKEQGKEYNLISARKLVEGFKEGIDGLNLEQKKVLRNLITKGAFGVAQYLVVSWLMNDDKIKYGYAYNTFDPFHRKMGTVMGSDGKPLKNGEWEIGGVRMPEVVNIAINHSPYFLSANLAAIHHQQFKRTNNGGVKNLASHIVSGDINELAAKLPFSTPIDLLLALTGDEYKMEHLIAQQIPTLPNVAKWTDKDANGETIKRNTDAPTFFGRVGNIVQSNTPYFNRNLPIKGQSTPTQQDLNNIENTKANTKESAKINAAIKFEHSADITKKIEGDPKFTKWEDIKKMKSGSKERKEAAQKNADLGTFYKKQFSESITEKEKEDKKKQLEQKKQEYKKPF